MTFENNPFTEPCEDGIWTRVSWPDSISKCWFIEMKTFCRKYFLQKKKDGIFTNSQAGAWGNWLLLDQLMWLLGSNLLSGTQGHPYPWLAGKFFLLVAMAVGRPRPPDPSLPLLVFAMGVRAPVPSRKTTHLCNLSVVLRPSSTSPRFQHVGEDQS